MICWDDCSWDNTHIETSEGMYHVGTHWDADGNVRLALATAADDKDGSPDPQIILLTDDDADTLLRLLRHSLKSL